MSNVLELIPNAGSIHKNRVKTYVSEWESADGFFQGFACLLAAKIANAVGETAQIGDDLGRAAKFAEASRILKIEASNFARVSHGEAIEAAFRISKELTSIRYLLPVPKHSVGFQHIHMIGHSRGAALNAMISRLLALDNYEIAEFTALDGFSTDWPDDGGLIGDISIINETRANRRVNYRVDQDLANYIVDLMELEDHPETQALIDAMVYVTAAANTRFNAVAIAAALYPEKSTRDALRRLDLKAPIRSPGWENIIIHGTTSASHHLNVTELYVHSEHIYDNYLGKHRASTLVKECNQVQSLASRIDMFGPDKSTSRNRAQFVSGIRTQIQDDADFRDGSFEASGDLLLQAGKLTGFVSDNALIDAWLGVAADPGKILATLWKTRGNVALINSDRGAWVELTQTADTSIGQIIGLEDDAFVLSCDWNILNAGPNDVLEVTFGGKSIHQLSLAGTQNVGTLKVSLSGLHGAGEFAFRLGGPVENPAIVRLDNLHIEYVGARILGVSLTPTGKLRFEIHSHVGNRCAIDASNDLETWNQIHTLQFTSLPVATYEEIEPPIGARFYRVRVLAEPRFSE